MRSLTLTLYKLVIIKLLSEFSINLPFNLREHNYDINIIDNFLSPLVAVSEKFSIEFDNFHELINRKTTYVILNAFEDMLSQFGNLALTYDVLDALNIEQKETFQLKELDKLIYLISNHLNYMVFENIDSNAIIYYPSLRKDLNSIQDILEGFELLRPKSFLTSNGVVNLNYVPSITFPCKKKIKINPESKSRQVWISKDCKTLESQGLFYSSAVFPSKNTWSDSKIAFPCMMYLNDIIFKGIYGIHLVNLRNVDFYNYVSTTCTPENYLIYNDPHYGYRNIMESQLKSSKLIDKVLVKKAMDFMNSEMNNFIDSMNSRPRVRFSRSLTGYRNILHSKVHVEEMCDFSAYSFYSERDLESKMDEDINKIISAVNIFKMKRIVDARMHLHNFR